ncbi:MAG: glycosyltransferase family 2 protein, partial [Clostridium sp.]
MNGDINPNIDTLNYIKNYQDFILDEDIRFTSIIILTYNQLEYTKLCIESIRAFTAKSCYEIIVVDNNSSDETVMWLKEQEDLVVIYNEKN